jgi:hypothetical protein
MTDGDMNSMVFSNSESIYTNDQHLLESSDNKRSLDDPIDPSQPDCSWRYSAGHMSRLVPHRQLKYHGTVDRKCTWKVREAEQYCDLTGSALVEGPLTQLLDPELPKAPGISAVEDRRASHSCLHSPPAPACPKSMKGHPPYRPLHLVGMTLIGCVPPRPIARRERRCGKPPQRETPVQSRFPCSARWRLHRNPSRTNFESKSV